MESNYNNTVYQLSQVYAAMESIKGIESPLFSLSIYENGIPGSGKTFRRVIQEIKAISIESLSAAVKSVPANHELALNSRIISGGKLFHMGFIDFSCDTVDDYFYSAIEKLKTQYQHKLWILDSGRSFHGYQDVLLSERQWYDYLGCLLLLNDYKISNREIVDSRWIGHSLRQGFSALRITRNTEAYKRSPSVQEIL
jgi:hypothetical protein